MDATEQAPSLRQPRRANLLVRWCEWLIPHSFAWLATSVYGLSASRNQWPPVLMRAGAHLAIVVVAVAAFGLSRVEWPAQAAASLSAPALSASSQGETPQPIGVHTASKLDEQSPAPELQQQEINSDRIVVVRFVQPHTVIPERPRLGVITYSVKAGDTVQTIAATFGLRPETILWSNPEVEDAPDLLQIGQELAILPLDGVYHEVTDEDTLASIAGKYKVSPEMIVDCVYNGLDTRLPRIQAGTRLIVPGGEKPYVAKVVTVYEGPVPEGTSGSGMFQWPLVGTITQGYWYGHRAIDIYAPMGSALLAADGGFVSFAGWTDVGYGYLVVIDHANGFVTYYAHMSNIYVGEGQAVERGQVIGAVGSTGWSTGPHLHFEVRYNGAQHNPWAYLP